MYFKINAIENLQAHRAISSMLWCIKQFLVSKMRAIQVINYHATDLNILLSYCEITLVRFRTKLKTHSYDTHISTVISIPMT